VCFGQPVEAINVSLTSEAEALPSITSPATVLAKATFHTLCGPLTAAKPRTRKRKAEKATVLTASPYKKMLEEKQTTNGQKGKAKKSSRSKKQKELQKSKVNDRKKNERGKSKGCCRSKRSQNAKDRDTVPCATCDVRRCDDKWDRNWIQCQDCLKWYHCECQGLEDNYKGKNFWCLECEYDSD